MNENEITEELEKKNDEIERLIEERTKFLDEHMSKFAEFQVGDEVYCISGGEKTVVTGHRRYNPGGIGYNDNSLYDVHVHFKNGDNAPCKDFHNYVSAHDYENKTGKYVKKLELFMRYHKEAKRREYIKEMVQYYKEERGKYNE